jgi:hypothetical protein
MNDIDREIAEERNRESQITHYDSWLSDNLRDLKKEFYKEMLKNTPEGIILDGERIEENDIDEAYPSEFTYFCKEEYKLWSDNK